MAGGKRKWNMPEIKNVPEITGDELVNVNRNAIEHRATWMGLIYEEAEKAGVDGEDIIREAVARTGCLHGSAIKAKLKTPARLDEFADAFLTDLGLKTFEMEITRKTEDELEIRFHYCPLVAAWLKAGIPPKNIPILCDLAMEGDRAIAETVGVDFILGATIAAGHPVCELRFFRSK